MGPEIHYEIIRDRVTELREEAAAHRRAREAEQARKSRENKPERRYRSAFGKLRSS